MSLPKHQILPIGQFGEASLMLMLLPSTNQGDNEQPESDNWIFTLTVIYNLLTTTPPFRLTPLMFQYAKVTGIIAQQRRGEISASSFRARRAEKRRGYYHTTFYLLPGGELVVYVMCNEEWVWLTLSLSLRVCVVHKPAHS